MTREHDDGVRGRGGVVLRTLGEHAIRAMTDGYYARRAIGAYGLEVGFGRIQSAELVIVASELCTNIVKYGGRGTLRAQHVVHDVHGDGLLLNAWDEGPAFQSFDRAVRDWSDERGTIPPEALNKRTGIAAGLGAVKRLTHLLWTEPEEQGGKNVVAVRYVAAPLSPEWRSVRKRWPG